MGLDIGTSSIKAAVLKPRGKGRGFTLQNLAMEPLPELCDDENDPWQWDGCSTRNSNATNLGKEER